MTAVKQATVTTNIDWFKDNDLYMANQSRLECYQNIQQVVQRELRGVRDLLDIGNGGFFNYDVSLVGHVTAVDLFLPECGPPAANCSFATGSILDLPLP